MELRLCMNCMREKKQDGPCPHCGWEAKDNEYFRWGSASFLRQETILYGRYIVGRVLRYCANIVYVGWDLKLERKVIIKEFFPWYSWEGAEKTRDNRKGSSRIEMSSYSEKDKKELRRFADEARQLCKFWRLPGISSVLDYFFENNTAYAVMEYAEGKNLREYLKYGAISLPSEIVFCIMKPTIDTLGKIHEFGLSHGFIGEEKLIIDAKGNVKLTDFVGNDALVPGEYGEGYVFTSLDMCMFSGYLDACICRHDKKEKYPPGPCLDVYMLCSVMYKAMTGKGVPLFFSMLFGSGEQPVKRPSELGIMINPKQEEALMKGLTIKQKDRYQNAGELSKALFG